MHKCQYTNVFAMHMHQKYIAVMSDKMRKILNRLMELKNDTPTSLSIKSGVTQPTIHRFINGRVRNMNSDNARKLAECYGLNESQLRGDIPIEWLDLETSIKEEKPNKTENDDLTKILKKFGLNKSNLTVDQLERFCEFLNLPEDKQTSLLAAAKKRSVSRKKGTGKGENSEPD